MAKNPAGLDYPRLWERNMGEDKKIIMALESCLPSMLIYSYYFLHMYRLLFVNFVS